MDMAAHPLVMPEVLANVFQYLNVEDLFTSRLVCSAWNAEASPLIGLNIKTSITDYSHFARILNLTKNYPLHPYRSFELQDVRISLEVPHVEEFFAVCGPYIHHLTVWYNRDTNDDTLSVGTLRDILLYNVPFLKSLTLQYLPHSIFSKEYLFPPRGCPHFSQPVLPYLKSLTLFSDMDLRQSFLEDIFSLSSSVESITVEFGITPDNFKQRLISAMLAKQHHLKNLRTLKYFMHDYGPGSGWSWSPEECETLANTGWNLRNLKLNPARSDSDKGFMYLMENLKNSLARLTVRVHHPLRFPVLNFLVHLTLHDYEENLSFLEQLPNLRYLGLCEYFPAKTVSAENIIKKPCQSLTSLNLFGSTISDYLFKQIIVCLPNLRNLNFWRCNKMKFRCVVKYSKLLEELIINVADMDDESLTGIPSDICDQIERRLKNKSSYHDFSNELQFRSKRFIGDLKNLQRLEMHGACLEDWRWSSVGDVSLIFGVAVIPNLTSLVIKEFKWITEDAIKDIVQKAPLQQLKFDPREFRESLESQIRWIRPNIRLEYLTDDYEQYTIQRRRGLHSVNRLADHEIDFVSLVMNNMNADFI